MKESRNKTLLWVVVALFLLSYLLPYTLFSGVDAWYGSFLWWTLATLVVIGINAIVSADWKD